MIKRLSLTVLVAAAIVTLVAGPASATEATTTPLFGDNQCSVVMQNPHFSTGANGNIAKATWKCGLVPTTIEYTTGGLDLFRCGVNPPHNYDTIFNTCAFVGDNADPTELNVANTGVTRYTPPLGQPGARGSGWYIAVANWQSHGPDGAGTPVTSFSNSVFLSS